MRGRAGLLHQADHRALPHGRTSSLRAAGNGRHFARCARAAWDGVSRGRGWRVAAASSLTLCEYGGCVAQLATAVTLRVPWRWSVSCRPWPRLDARATRARARARASTSTSSLSLSPSPSPSVQWRRVLGPKGRRHPRLRPPARRRRDERSQASPLPLRTTLRTSISIFVPRHRSAIHMCGRIVRRKRVQRLINGRLRRCARARIGQEHRRRVVARNDARVRVTHTHMRDTGARPCDT
ncbi:hypothetical protein BC628DRAFT_908013 [Trametes gibbosa]|nr:hypothetical protein BC628DRAFT_908013 [Trametes gibbosa]